MSYEPALNFKFKNHAGPVLTGLFETLVFIDPLRLPTSRGTGLYSEAE